MLDSVFSQKLKSLTLRQHSESETKSSSSSSIKKVFGDHIDEFVCTNVRRGKKYMSNSNSNESDKISVP
jgi:hypothetical protein